MNSLWVETSSKPSFKSLEKDIKTDVLIIGGGIAGILTAYMLDKQGVNYALAEAKTIGFGITRNTTAKITLAHGLIYDKIVNSYGTEKAKGYLEVNNSAIKEYKDLCSKIDCDFEEKNSYVYSLDDIKALEKEAVALRKLGFNAKLTDNVTLPFKVAGAIKYSHQAEFNPLKFIYSISNNLNIYENTEVKELIGTTAITENGKITAKKIIVATHFPFINKHGGYFIKMYQHRSYVIALENAENVDGMYVDKSMTGLSFRNYKDLLLIGGGDHRTGKNGGNYNELRKFAKKYFPNSVEKYHWATQDCMTLDGIPYIGQYSATTTDLYVATGFNKWGMTSAMVSAFILSDLVSGKQNRYSDIFSPSRSIFHPQLAVNLFEAVAGIVYPTTKRCPHLGCALKWNKYEHSWDCSCHGSRFTKDGKLIDNPATGDLK